MLISYQLGINIHILLLEFFVSGLDYSSFNLQLFDSFGILLCNKALLFRQNKDLLLKLQNLHFQIFIALL